MTEHPSLPPTDPAPGTEIELKFEIAPDDVRTLTNAPWLKAMQTGRAAARALIAVYFDTPERRLLAAGMQLRVRKEGRRFIQCLKGDDGQNGLFARAEWEAEVASPLPDPTVLGGIEAVSDLLPPEQIARLIPLFETRIRRVSRRLRTEGGTEIALDLDIGTISGAVDGVVHDVSVHEVELELISGDPARLFEVARKIMDTVPARLGKKAKSARGHELISTDAPAWRKSAKIELSRKTTAEEALALTVTRNLAHLAANEDCVLARAHVEGVHQMRVAMRRLRSILTIYRPLLPPSQYDWLTDDTEAVIAALGPARDWDVFLDETLGPVMAWNPGVPQLGTLRQAATRARDDAYEKAVAMILGRPYTEMLIDFADWLHAREWRSGENTGMAAPITDLAVATLNRVHRKLRKKGRGFAKMSPDERHRLRIAVKRMRYTAEFFASLFPEKPTARFLANLEVLQDGLGRLNDVAVAANLVRRLTVMGRGETAAALNYAAGMVVGWHANSAREHDAEMVAAWKRFARTKPFWN